MGHADRISARDAYKISGQNVSACLVETSPRAPCNPAWAEPRPWALPSQRLAPAPLQCNELLPNWSCLTPPPFFCCLFWLHHENSERDCAPFAAENALQWTTELQKSLDAYPCLSKLFLSPYWAWAFVGFFFQKFPESAHCIERRTLNWTKMTAVLSYHLY